MNKDDSRAVVERFNDCINASDAEGLASLMTEDHVFIDSAGHSVAGKAACVDAWRGFFEMFPDYRNEFARLVLLGEDVVIIGRSLCADPRLDGPALWKAVVRDRKVAQWRVYDDTPGMRDQLGLQ